MPTSPGRVTGRPERRVPRLAVAPRVRHPSPVTPDAPRPRATPAEELRRIALHQETAALLEQRALRAASPVEADLLRRRAAEHARQAQLLRAALSARRGARVQPAPRGSP